MRVIIEQIGGSEDGDSEIFEAKPGDCTIISDSTHRRVFRLDYSEEELRIMVAVDDANVPVPK